MTQVYDLVRVVPGSMEALDGPMRRQVPCMVARCRVWFCVRGGSVLVPSRSFRGTLPIRSEGLAGLGAGLAWALSIQVRGWAGPCQ